MPPQNTDKEASVAVAMLQTAEMFTKEIYDQVSEKMFGHTDMRPEEAPEGLILHSAGQGDRGWYVYDICESPPSSTPGVPPKSRPSDSRSRPSPLSESISSSAASSCSSVAGRMYADAGTLSDGPISIVRYRFSPVAAGISFPMITFSFRPSSRSTLPSIDASVSTLVVSWKEAAERNDSVANDALVIPRISGSHVACSPDAPATRVFSRSSTTLSTS